MMRRLLLVAFAAGVLLACFRSQTLSNAPPHAASRPALTDPSPGVRPPASMEEVAIQSDGSRMNGLVYHAAGPGAHPVVVFLHGYPGNEKNLDLAQAVRRAGFQAVYFDYRGMWGSGGTFAFRRGLEDEKAVLAWVRSPEVAARHHFDIRRIAIVGHSYGGWVALMSAWHEPQSVCVAGLAAWNIGWAGRRFPAHTDERTSGLDYFRATTDPAGGPVRASAGDLINEMAEHAAEMDYLDQAGAIGNRALLLVAATRDSADEDVPMHAAMSRALRAAGNNHVRLVRYEDDHPFSSHRIALANLLIDWLVNDCRATQR
jgi:pimeloyl-ACP methyl ester carboxylesterase